MVQLSRLLLSYPASASVAPHHQGENRLDLRPTGTSIGAHHPLPTEKGITIAVRRHASTVVLLHVAHHQAAFALLPDAAHHHLHEATMIAAETIAAAHIHGHGQDHREGAGGANRTPRDQGLRQDRLQEEAVEAGETAHPDMGVAVAGEEVQAIAVIAVEAEAGV